MIGAQRFEFRDRVEQQLFRFGKGDDERQRTDAGPSGSDIGIGETGFGDASKQNAAIAIVEQSQSLAIDAGASRL